MHPPADAVYSNVLQSAPTLAPSCGNECLRAGNRSPTAQVRELPCAKRERKSQADGAGPPAGVTLPFGCRETSSMRPGFDGFVHDIKGRALYVRFRYRF